MEIVTLIKNRKTLTNEGKAEAVRILEEKLEQAKYYQNAEAFKYWIRKLTKITHDILLTEKCKYCGKYANEIHHKRYRIPIRMIDVIRCCHKCNVKQGEGEVIWV